MLSGLVGRSGGTRPNPRFWRPRRAIPLVTPCLDPCGFVGPPRSAGAKQSRVILIGYGKIGSKLRARCGGVGDPCGDHCYKRLCLPCPESLALSAQA